MSNQAPPSMHLVSAQSPAHPVTTEPSSRSQSKSSFRYLNERTAATLGERDTPLTDVSSSSHRVTPHRPSSSRSPSPSSPPIHHPPRSRITPTPILIPPRVTFFSWERLKPWIPIIIYAISSLGFVAAIIFWKSEVFKGLDDLSHTLQADAYTGYAVLFFLIFITTFPPLPLYSTFITLSGYTFGPWTGAVISYFAALSGAVCVYFISRTFFCETISRWLLHTTTIKRVVRAIEKRPKLLFMVRLAPYPYNVMNALLAASPSLTFRTYFVCTALSLFKVIIHTTIGASIHSFAGYHLHPSDPSVESPAEESSTLSRVSAVIGIILCVGIIVYLAWVARKAVDQELDDDVPAHDAEESQRFLDPTNDDLESGMSESPFTAHPLESLNGQGSLRLSSIDGLHSSRGRR